MNSRGRFWGWLLGAAVVVSLLAGGTYAFQLPQRLLDILSQAEDDDVPQLPVAPPDQFGYVFARLAFAPSDPRAMRGHAWTTDYPKADRQFLLGVLRYTRIQARRQEQVVRPLDPKLFALPFLYAVEVGYCYFSEEEAARLREYLERGGFLVVDDFHGTREWENFEQQIRKVFPNRPIREVELSDPIFHSFYDITEKIQVPGLQYLYTGRKYEQDGYEAHYRAIYDDKGRIMVMINFNVDLGDAWEWADLPEYAEVYTSTAYRLGVNYIVYSMTH